MHATQRATPPKRIRHALARRHVAHAFNLARARVDVLGVRRVALVRLDDARHRFARRARLVIQLGQRGALCRQHRGTLADHAIVRAERQAHRVEPFSEGKQEQIRFAPRLARATGAPLVVLTEDSGAPARRESRDTRSAPFLIRRHAGVWHQRPRPARRSRNRR
nr:hypothetical protein [Burkholderia ambifaria]